MATLSSTSRADLWLRLFALLVPKEIRRQFLDDLLAERREMQERGVSRIRIELASFNEILNGIAQHVPLEPMAAGVTVRPQLAERAAWIGWIAWRIAGPALLVGFLVGPAPLFWYGVCSLALAFTCVITVTVAGPAPLSLHQRSCWPCSPSSCWARSEGWPTCSPARG
jgi:hypothetical protein